MPKQSRKKVSVQTVLYLSKKGILSQSLLRKLALYTLLSLFMIQLEVSCRLLPIHTPLEKIPTGTGSCLPDQVQIIDPLSTQTTDGPTNLWGKCVKCTQFNKKAQTCQIESIRLQIINIKLLESFEGASFGDCHNGYKQSGAICFHTVMQTSLPQNSHRSCFSDIPHCYRCRNNWPNKCANCGYGYYGDSMQYQYDNQSNPIQSIGYQYCKPLMDQPNNPNCLMGQIGEEQRCKKCQDGFYKDGNQKCQACINGCLECSNQTDCTKCDDQHKLDASTCVRLVLCTSGTQCSSRCYSASINSGNSVLQCQKCQSDFFRLRQVAHCSSDCSKIYKNCEICYFSLVAQEALCRKCSLGYYVNQDGECQTCSKHRIGCSQCQTSKICTQCHILHYLENKACKPCSDAGNQCVKCQMALLTKTATTQSLICRHCSKGYFLNHNHPITPPTSISSQCTQCADNCIQCSDNNSCDRCTKEYFWDSASIQCKQCQDIFTNCTICKVDLNTSQPVCRICQRDFALQPDTRDPQKMVCGPCSYLHKGCTKCQKITQCTQCDQNSGYYLDIVTWNCTACLPPCKQCTKKYKCVTCVDNFLVKNQTKGDCLSCDKIIPNCLKCQSYLQPNTTSSYVNECTQCKSYHILVSNPSNDPLIPKICHPCDPYSFTDQTNPLTPCIPCSQKCQQCSGPNQCRSCIHAYAKRWIDSKLDCYDKCGDKKIATLDCDLDIGNLFDGCTSQCQVEPGFVCQLYFSKDDSLVPDKQDKAALASYLQNLSERNSDEHFYSRCSYNGKVKMSIKHILKEKFSNQLSIEVKLEPFLHTYKFLSSLELHSLFKLFHNSSIVQSSLYTTELVPKNESVLFTLQLEHHLTQPLTIELSHSVLPDQKNFTFTQDSSLTFISDDQTGLKAFFYKPEELNLWKSVYTAMQVLSIVAIIGTLVSVALKNLAGIEFLWILQSMYVSLFWYQEPLTLPMFSLSGLSFSTGFNPSATFSKPYTSQTINSRLLYESSFIPKQTSHFIELQLTVFIFPLMYLLSQLAWVFEDVRNPTVVIWARKLNAFFFNEGLMLAALFMLQSLLNQALTLYFGWNVLEPFSQYLSTMMIAFGGVCMLIVIVGWLKAEQPKYEKSNKKNRPYDLLLSAFSRYNMPIIKQKFYSLYIMIMIFSTLSSVFLSFYPLMPGLLYIFLAFLIGIYRPYNRPLSNYRALFFAVVIAFGYFLRVVYIFSFAQEPSKPQGYTLGNVWVIYFWIVLVIAAFIFFAVDVVKSFRQSREIAKQIQEKFKQNIEGKNKFFQKKMVEQAKKYQSHKNQLQNLLYNNFYHHGIGPKIDFDDCKNEKELQKKIEQVKQKTKPKPVEKDEVFYISNKNSKKPRKQSPQNEGSDKTIKNRVRNDESLNQWVEEARQKLQQERVQKAKKLHQKQLLIAYEITKKILEQKEELIEERFKLYEVQGSSNFDLMTKLVQLEKAQRIKKTCQESFDTNIQGETSERKKDLQSLINQIKEENMEEFKAVKACEKEKRGRNAQNNFPQVQIHYKKAQKINEWQSLKYDQERKPKLKIKTQEILDLSDEKVRRIAIKRQLKDMALNNKNPKKQSRVKMQMNKEQ